jgi:hypothetical protein
MFDRSFTFSPDAHPDRGGTATPFLRKGIVPHSKLLISQSLAFTRVRFTFGTAEAILRSFPDRQNDVNRYINRLKIQFPNRISAAQIGEASRTFTIKKKMLRTMCMQWNVLDPTIIELFRMFVITASGDLRKDS